MRHYISLCGEIPLFPSASSTLYWMPDNLLATSSLSCLSCLSYSRYCRQPACPSSPLTLSSASPSRLASPVWGTTSGWGSSEEQEHGAGVGAEVGAGVGAGVGQATCILARHFSWYLNTGWTCSRGSELGQRVTRTWVPPASGWVGLPPTSTSCFYLLLLLSVSTHCLDFLLLADFTSCVYLLLLLSSPTS